MSLMDFARRQARPRRASSLAAHDDFTDSELEGARLAPAFGGECQGVIFNIFVFGKEWRGHTIIPVRD